MLQDHSDEVDPVNEDKRIDLGPDFPLSDAARERRERIAEWLENALYGIRHDPIGGNVRHCVEMALHLMDEQR